MHSVQIIFLYKDHMALNDLKAYVHLTNFNLQLYDTELSNVVALNVYMYICMHM